MHPKVSVIISVWNGKETIIRCLNSVLAQTLPDWECIVVDDGSTDGTGRLLQSFQSGHPRIQVHAIPHGGVSRAKNLGMEMAAGETITFVDCDDFLEPTALSALYQHMSDTKADVAIGHLCLEDLQGRPLPGTPPLQADKRLFSPQAAVETIFQGQPFAGHLPGKLLRADRFREFRYREDISIYEDMLFCAECLRHARLIAYLPKVVYHYVVHPGGAMAATLTQRKASSLSACAALCALVQNDFPAILPAARRFATQNALWVLEEWMAMPAATRKEAWALATRKAACQTVRSWPIPAGLSKIQRCFGIALKMGWPFFVMLFRGPFRLLQLLNLPNFVKGKNHKLHMADDLIPRENVRHVKNF